MTEPEKVIAPMATPRPSSIRLTVKIWPARIDNAEGCRIETGAQAPPAPRRGRRGCGSPRPVRGIAVIAMRRATMNQPIDRRRWQIAMRRSAAGIGDVMGDQRRHHRDRHADHADSGCPRWLVAGLTTARAARG